MRGFLTFAAALCCAGPALAHGHELAEDDQRAAVIAGADAFFEALRSEDKTALAGQMLGEGMIFIHDRRDPDNPRVLTRSVADHVAGWAQGTSSVDELMSYDHVLIDGDMAQVWGYYNFWVEGELSHCGINSMSMVRGDDGAWKVGNTSFSMLAPSECREVFPQAEVKKVRL